MKPPIVGLADVSALMSLYTAPMVAFGFMAHGGARWSTFSLTGGLRAEFSLSDGIDNLSLSTSRLVGELVPCFPVDLGEIALFGCGVVQAGQLTISARGEMPNFLRKLNQPSISAGGRFIIQLHRSFLPRGWDPFISVDLMGALLRTNLYSSNVYEWNAPVLTTAIGLGLVFAR